jgi:hypothetical protein
MLPGPSEKSILTCGMAGIERCRNRSQDESVKEPGLDNRHRAKYGEISRKHGSTLVRTLRKIYGSGFALDLMTATNSATLFATPTSRR